MPHIHRIILTVGLLIGIGCNAAFGQSVAITGVEELTSMQVDDCDGIAVGDINGDGAVDLLTSSGSEGEVFWFEQGADPTEWRRHKIYSGATEIEGNALADFNGDGQVEGISLDQKGNAILLHRPDGDPQGLWTTEVIQSGRAFVQESIVTDVDEDGRPELIYTWEGTAPNSGGVRWLDLEGEAVLDPDAWTDHAMVTHESAWWIPSQRLDVNEDGRASEIIYTARNLQNRNAGARPGLFWIEPGDAPTTDWHRHAIDTTLVHPLHVDVGRFSSGPERRDLIIGGFDTQQVHFYTWNASWDRHALELPEIDGKEFREIWNVKAIPVGEQRRDAMLVVVSQEAGSAMVLFQYREGQYQSQVVRQMPYTHPMDDRLVLRDLTGNDRPELIVPDSGGNRLSIFRFEWTD